VGMGMKFITMSFSTIDNVASSACLHVVQRVEFWAEADRWSRLSHPNVVCVVGLCRGVDAHLSLLYEFAFYGDLHEYLLVHSPHSDIAVVDSAGRSDRPPSRNGNRRCYCIGE